MGLSHRIPKPSQDPVPTASGPAARSLPGTPVVRPPSEPLWLVGSLVTIFTYKWMVKDPDQEQKSRRRLKGIGSVQRAEENLENDTSYIVRLNKVSHSENWNTPSEVKNGIKASF